MKHQALQECFILKTGPGLAGKLLFPWKLLFSSTGAWCRCQWSVKGISALQPVLGQVCQNPLSPWVCSSSIFYSEIPPGMLEKSQLPFSFPVLVSEVPEAVLVSQHPEVLPQTSPSQLCHHRGALGEAEGHKFLFLQISTFQECRGNSCANPLKSIQFD